MRPRHQLPNRQKKGLPRPPPPLRSRRRADGAAPRLRLRRRRPRRGRARGLPGPLQLPGLLLGARRHPLHLLLHLPARRDGRRLRADPLPARRRPADAEPGVARDRADRHGADGRRGRRPAALRVPRRERAAAGGARRRDVRPRDQLAPDGPEGVLLPDDRRVARHLRRVGAGAGRRARAARRQPRPRDVRVRVHAPGRRLGRATVHLEGRGRVQRPGARAVLEPRRLRPGDGKVPVPRGLAAGRLRRQQGRGHASIVSE